MEQTHKVCTKCGKEKLIEEFSEKTQFYLTKKGVLRSYVYRNSWCDTCKNAKSGTPYERKTIDVVDGAKTKRVRRSNTLTAY